MEPTVRTRYVKLQWKTLIILMVGYICYYFLRKNFSAAIPAMEATLGLSKVQLGIFLTLHPEIAAEAKALGIETTLWLVNDLEVASWARKHGIDYISSDFPQMHTSIRK